MAVSVLRDYGTCCGRRQHGGRSTIGERGSIAESALQRLSRGSRNNKCELLDETDGWLRSFNRRNQEMDDRNRRESSDLIRANPTVIGSRRCMGDNAWGSYGTMVSGFLAPFIGGRRYSYIAERSHRSLTRGQWDRWKTAAIAS